MFHREGSHGFTGHKSRPRAYVKLLLLELGGEFLGGLGRHCGGVAKGRRRSPTTTTTTNLKELRIFHGAATKSEREKLLRDCEDVLGFRKRPPAFAGFSPISTVRSRIHRLHRSRPPFLFEVSRKPSVFMVSRVVEFPILLVHVHSWSELGSMLFIHPFGHFVYELRWISWTSIWCIVHFCYACKGYSENRSYYSCWFLFFVFCFVCDEKDKIEIT